MNILVESLKRLYENKKISEEKVLEIYKNGKLAIKDVNYILDKQGKETENE